MSHYKHLSIEERESIYLRKGQGKKIREIARELGRSPSTISRELARNKPNRRSYRPSAAQRQYEHRRKNCGRKPILCGEKERNLVRVLLCERQWSPEQIANRLALEGNELQISYATIYRAVKRGLLDEKTSGYVRKKDRCIYHLRRKGKPRKPNNKENKQGKFHIERTIWDRPEEANNRTERGHWEGDTVAGTMGGSLLVTQVDRKTGYLLGRKGPNGCAETVKEAMNRMFGPLPEDMVRSITLDRGHEFAKYAEVSAELHNVPIYFADPHSPWQRGTNENTNGLLRQYFPKYTSLDGVSEEELQAVIDKLNLRPRKRLGWRSPFEAFFLTSLHLT